MEKFVVNFIDERGNERSKTVKNSLVPISKFIESLPDDCILVAEHTGVYGDLLLYLSNQVDVPSVLCPAAPSSTALAL